MKDVRYLKVMKPNLDGNVANENDNDNATAQGVEIIEENDQTQFQDED
jgi:hypothetical protein